MAQVPLAAVSARKSKRLRGSELVIHYFESVGSSTIIMPPPLSTEKHGVQLHDIFVHKSHDGSQAWQCHSLNPTTTWTLLEEMKEYAVGDSGLRRPFVLTGTGSPSFVQWDTIGRLYKHKAQDTRITPTPVAEAHAPRTETDKKGKKRATIV